MAATFSNQTGTVRGCVNFNGGVVERHAAVTATATVNVPASCTMGFPCSVVQTLAQMYLPGATCANAAGGGCDCTATRTTNFNDVAAFTNAGGVLTMADGGTYVSCVSPATTLKYTRPDGGVENGQYTLTLQ